MPADVLRPCNIAPSDNSLAIRQLTPVTQNGCPFVAKISSLLVEILRITLGGRTVRAITRSYFSSPVFTSCASTKSPKASVSIFFKPVFVHTGVPFAKHERIPGGGAGVRTSHDG